MENMDQWHRKNTELNALKKHFKKLMGSFNTLRCEYSDWFTRQHGSFLFVVKSVQVMMGPLVPQEVCSITDFREILAMSVTKRDSGQPISGVDKMETYLAYWSRFSALKVELDRVMGELNSYVWSIRTLREPEVKTEMDKHYENITFQCSEGYNFSKIYNVRDNLYTYRVRVPEHKFLGLASYLPHLLTLATKCCFLSTRINLEKE